MTDSKGMNVSQGPESLIGIELDQYGWHLLFHFVIVFENSVNCLWNIVHDKVEVYFFRLFDMKISKLPYLLRCRKHASG